MPRKYKLNPERFVDVLKRVDRVMTDKYGIFEHGWTTFLHEFDLPREFENTLLLEDQKIHLILQDFYSQGSCLIKDVLPTIFIII